MSSFYKNLKRDIQSKFSLLFSNKYKSFGLKWAEVKKIRAIQDGEIHAQEFLNGKIYFRNGNEILHGLDEIFVDEVYKISLPRNAYIIDCGSHIGLSVIYFKNKYPDATIIAFEPDATNFDLLKRNVESFNLKNVILRNEAVWKEDTIISFSYDGNMSSKIDITNESNKNQSSIKAIKLFDVIDRSVDFLKLDIEGAEYLVLIDIYPKLDIIQSMFIEYHGSFKQNNELNQILQMITEKDFKYYIKEASPIYNTPFSRDNNKHDYDIQLNIFCFR